MWFNLRHEHILPFLGVASDEESGLSMVLGWAENGSLSHYIDRLNAQGLSRLTFVDQWVCPSPLDLPGELV